MSDAENPPRYEIELKPPALRAIAEQLPISVAVSVLMWKVPWPRTRSESASRSESPSKA